AQNDVEKQKLSLARAIGLPSGQAFVLTDRMPEAIPTAFSLEQAIADAASNRPDFKRAQSAVHSAELRKKAAIAKALPTARFDGDVGAIGRAPGNARETYSATVSLNMPVFQCGRVRG